MDECRNQRRSKRRWGLGVVTTLLAAVVGVQPAAAAPAEPIGLDDVALTVSTTGVWQMPGSYSLVGLQAAGTAVIDCLDHSGCHDGGHHGAQLSVSQSAGLLLNERTGRMRGRIVIDVIHAGFTGQVRGQATDLGGGTFDVSLSIRAAVGDGNRLTFEQNGAIDRLSGFVGELTGSGIVSMDDLDQI